MTDTADDEVHNYIRSGAHDFDREQEHASACKIRGDLYDRALKLGLLNRDGTLTDKGRQLGQVHE